MDRRACWCVAEVNHDLPELGFTDAGIYWPHGPVHEVDLQEDALVHKINELVAKGNPSIPHPPRSELNKWTTIQKAIGIGSWKKMAREGIVTFVLHERDNGVLLARSPQGAKDIQLVDYPSGKFFPEGTSTAEIVREILHEVCREA